MKRFLQTIFCFYFYFISAQAQPSLYGLTSAGGVAGGGTILNYRDSPVAVLNFPALGKNDYAGPEGSLVQATNGLLYGMSSTGGFYGDGIVFSYNPTNGAYRVLHNFRDTTYDGAYPSGSLVQASNDTLYGMTSTGGPYGNGVVFSIDTSGSFSLLHRFGVDTVDGISDGMSPFGSLIQASNGLLYGMTIGGGNSGSGVIFSISTSGSYSILHSFGAATVVGSVDGNAPYGSLVQASSGILYGMTTYGGNFGNGVIFSIDTSGNYSILHNFSGPPSDGAFGLGSLIQATNGLLYGMTNAGGIDSVGTIFSISTSGSYSLLHSFSFSPSDGHDPYGSLVQASNGILYGMTTNGGIAYDNDNSSYGTIFSYNPGSSSYANLYRLNATTGYNPIYSSFIDVRTNTVGPLLPNAGPDQTIIQPIDSVTLDGSKSSESGGTIESYRWSQISGPGPAEIEKPDSVITVVNELQAGVYVFQLSITDALGKSASATVNITVDSCPSQPIVTEKNDNQFVSNYTSGSQWFYNGSLIPGAINQMYDPDGLAGKYTVQVTQYGCSSPMSDPVCIYPDVPVISGNLVTCFNEQEYTVNAEDSVSFVWSLSGGGTNKVTSDTSISVNWTEYGSYTITVIASAGGCSDAPVTAAVLISSPPTPVITTTNGAVLVSNTPDNNKWFLNGIAIPGETDDELETNGQPGSYTAKVVDGTCYSQASNSICVYPDSPIIQSSAGMDTVCPGYQKYDITNSQDSVSYQWSLGDIGDSITSFNQDFSEATISWINFGGERTINIIPSAGGCVGPMGSLTITVIALPAAPAIYFDTTDNELKISTVVGGDEDVQWLWNGATIYGVTAAEFKPSIPEGCGIYHAQISEEGCQSPVSNAVCVGPPKPGAINGDSVVCANQAVYSIDSMSFVNYQWMVTGGDIIGADSLGQVTVNWIVSGIDTLIVGDAAGGCPGDTSKMIVEVGSAPTQPVIKLLNGELESNSASGNQWYLNDTLIAGATAYNLTPADTGNYTVQVTINGCSSPMSNPYYIALTDTASASINVFPNPSSSEVIITNPSSNPYTIQLFDMNGTNLMELSHATGTQQLSLSRLAHGTYTILATDEVTKKQTSKKILKL
jgi:uncharacterized repeat protein (TIGR03803 family)